MTQTTQTSFIWQGKNSEGLLLSGEIKAASILLVKIELQTQGITAYKIKKKRLALFSFSSQQKIKPKDIALFTRQLASLLSAGIALVQALQIIAQGLTHPTLKQLIITIKKDVESGLTFAHSLKKHPRYFTSLYSNLIAAGETSGSLEIMLNRVASYREKMASMKAKVKKVLFYPATVLLLAFVITIGLLIFVVPKFQSIFSSFGAQLPLPTLIVIKLSTLLQHYGGFLLLTLFSLGYGFMQFNKRSISFTMKKEQLLLRLPLIGPALQQAALARFARTLATTFAAGLPLLEALQITAQAVGSKPYTQAILQIREQIATGLRIHQAMKAIPLFPAMTIQMIAVGEEAGSLEAMLMKIADFYEEEVDNTIHSLHSLLEPFIMIILGLMIGGLVIALYLPIFRMGNVMGSI